MPADDETRWTLESELWPTGDRAQLADVSDAHHEGFGAGVEWADRGEELAALREDRDRLKTLLRSIRFLGIGFVWRRPNGEELVIDPAEITLVMSADEPTTVHDLRARLAEVEAERDRLREHILDIDAHATPYGDIPDEPGWTGMYLLTAGALHRALGKVGHSAPSCEAAKDLIDLRARLAEVEAEVEAERDAAVREKLDAVLRVSAVGHDSIAKVVAERDEARDGWHRSNEAMYGYRSRLSAYEDVVAAARVLVRGWRLHVSVTGHALMAAVDALPPEGPTSPPQGTVEAAARALVALKDGPRDEAYEAAKPAAWAALRRALSPPDAPPTDTEVTR